MSKNILTAVIFIFCLASCSFNNEKLNSENDLMKVSFSKNSAGILTILIENVGTSPISYYDSIFYDNEKIPYYIWVRKCGKYSNNCEKLDWISPNKMVSSLITIPVDLVSLNSGKSIEKNIQAKSIFEMSGLGDLHNEELVQFKIRIYLDSNLQEFVEYQSDWI